MHSHTSSARRKGNYTTLGCTTVSGDGRRHHGNALLEIGLQQMGRIIYLEGNGCDKLWILGLLLQLRKHL
jgi:hypothetical protein